MMRGPGLREDTKNLALIGGSALVAVLATGAMVAANTADARHVHVVRHEVVKTPPPPPAYELVEPLSGTNRLYGTVHTRSGRSYEGFLRWDRNEGSWSDVLDATKLDRGFTGLSGIRFGHVRKIESLGRNQALFTLRSGHEVGMRGQSSDLGRGLRALIIDNAANGQTELEWEDIQDVEFQSVPAGLEPSEGRLHGTLTTTSGLEVTGYITWDVDEIYSTDKLDGEAHGRDYAIPFGAIESIQRASSRSARVVLHSGEELTLSGTNDVDRRNSGISVSDPALGQVKVGWRAFESVRFHGTDSEAALETFDGGREIRGTVITAEGDELSGLIQWDRDEHQTWEMLNGQLQGADFQIEFSNIARIERNHRGSTVELRDGRSFDLDGSNDVDGENRGIVVTSGDQDYTVRWNDFRELRLEH